MIIEIDEQPDYVYDRDIGKLFIPHNRSEG